MDTNRSLTGVQKLGYLCAQLRGEASRVIAGFQLTNASYADSVQLLKDRFGQPYKQIDAHMQALIDLPGLTNSLSSTRDFYDATESHIRSLSALGKTQDTYGSLLVPILLGKLRGKIKQNLARSHSKREWTINELRIAIRDELYILEIGSQQTEFHTSSQPTVSFFQVQASQHTNPKGEHSVHFVRDHILLHCVKQSRTPNSDLTLYAKKDYALIVWGTTKYMYHHVTLNTDATTAGENTILACVHMVSNQQSLPIRSMLQRQMSHNKLNTEVQIQDQPPYNLSLHNLSLLQPQIKPTLAHYQ